MLATAAKLSRGCSCNTRCCSFRACSGSSVSKLCFRLLSTHFRLRLESGRTDSGRSYQAKSKQHLKATDHLGGLLFGVPSRVENHLPAELAGCEFGSST